MNNSNQPVQLAANLAVESEIDHEWYRQDARDTLGSSEHLAEMLLQDNGRYAAYKGEWTNTQWNGGGFTKTTTGRKDGKFYITREQINTDAIREGAQRYRKLAEAGVPDPMAPIGPDGQLQWSWMSLPNVIKIKICDDYFGGAPWEVVKADRTTKAQFYRVVEREYNDYVTYPGGRLPIPVDVPYPSKAGEKKWFKGL
jgi:hypothetical protein